MPRFFFDHREHGAVTRDEVGVDCPTLDHARDLAARGLGEWATEAMPGTERRELAIEVWDEDRRPLFTVALVFEVQPPR